MIAARTAAAAAALIVFLGIIGAGASRAHGAETAQLAAGKPLARVAGGAVLNTSSQSAEELTLVDALRIARAQNPNLAAAAEEMHVARGELTRAGYFSQYNFESGNEFAYRTRTGRSNSQDWRVGFAQQFEIFGQRGLRIKSASFGAGQAEAEFADRVRLLIGAVKLTFFDAIRARGRATLLADLEQLDARMLSAARTRMAAGEINEIEFNLSQVRYGLSHRALLETREQYRAIRSSLGRLLGGAAGPEPEPRGDFRIAPLAAPLEQLVAQARRMRPDLRALKLASERLSADASLNSRMNLPNPVLGVFGGHDQNTEHFAGPALGFSVPLFNRRTGEAEIIAARQRQTRMRLRATDLDIEREVRDAYHQYRTAQRALDSFAEEVVTPARRSFERLERAFREGKIDLIRLAIAERETFEAQTAYFDAWFKVMAAQTALELATGTSS
jgi:cobalt-zinc-cadmium efflux system outer membrane protein